MKREIPKTSTDRRAFLAKCGRYAIVTPPAVTLMLTASASNPAVAGSGFHSSGNNGFGNGGHDGVPGKSQHQDETR
jgi:hypothetical protein